MNKISNLYFITGNTFNQEVGQCDCDCDCACPPALDKERPSCNQLLETIPLFPAPGVQSYELDKHNFILLGGRESPAVLSSTCFDLFKAFPADVNEVIKSIPAQWNPEQVKNVIQQMVQHGVLVDDLARQHPHQDINSPILTAWIHTTTECNLACRYCYLPNQAGRLAPEVGYGIIDSLLRSARAHNYTILKLKYAGGEPLLNFSGLIDNFRYAKKQTKKTGIALKGNILTNGVLLNQNIIRQLKSNDLSLTISLDGIAAYHDANRPLHNGKGSFSLVEKGIRLAIEEGLKPSISITISAASASGLPKLVRWLLDLDLHFTFNFYRPNARSKHSQRLDSDNHHITKALLESYYLIEKHKPDFQFWNVLGDRVNLRRPHTRPCSVGKNYLVFDAHGNLAKCQMEMDTTLGDYHSPDPLKIIQDTHLGSQNVPVTQKAECSNCEWKLWCAGGCPVLAEYVTGNASTRSPYCEVYKEIIPVLLNMEAKSLLRRKEKPQK